MEPARERAGARASIRRSACDFDFHRDRLRLRSIFTGLAAAARRELGGGSPPIQPSAVARAGTGSVRALGCATWRLTPGRVLCAAPRLVPDVAHLRACRRAGLRPGATLRLAAQRTNGPSASPTPSARAEPTVSERAGLPSASAAGVTCKCGNSHWQEWPSGRPRVTRQQESRDRPAGVGPGDRVTKRRFSAWNPVSCQQSWPGKMPDPNTRTAAQSAAVAVLSCCTHCPVFRISLLTSGAKRTSCMPSGGTTSTHVHPCSSPSSRVPASPPASG